MASKESAGVVAASGKVREWPELVVSGCADQTISHIVKGVYRVDGMNHTKPVYKKYEKAKGLDVLVYFWDDRDGLELCGWWFGPQVGGDQVWAFHPSRTSTTPPANEWNIPNDGAIDPTFSITPRAPANRPKDGDKDDESVKKQIEAIKKERGDFAKRMEEIQKRADERKRREEELRSRMAEDKSGTKRPREADADDEEQRKRKELAVASARAEEERRRLAEEARKRRGEEERRVAQEAEKQRREEERRLAEEHARQRREQEDEERRRRLERRKKEEEDLQRRREAEAAQRRVEEDQRRREEAERMKERQRRLNEEARRRKEHICQLGMLEAMSRLAHAEPEDYDAYVRMLDRALEIMLPYTGKQKEALKAEADRILRRTAAYIKVAEGLASNWESWHELEQSLPPAVRT